MTGTVFDLLSCSLGEGPLWHPKRQQLFWFDINAKRLLSRTGDKTLDWQFDHHVSAAGWVDHETLLIANEDSLSGFQGQTFTIQLDHRGQPEHRVIIK